jgi:hypothetical protein
MPAHKQYHKPRFKARALNLGSMTAAQRMVYRAIHRYIRRFNTAYPSQAQLAAETGLSIRTVKRAVRALRWAGILDVSRSDARKGRHLRNTYSLTLAWKIVIRPAPKCKTERPHSQPFSGQNVPSKKLKALPQNLSPQPPTMRPWGARFFKSRSLRARGTSPRQRGLAPRQRRAADVAALLAAVRAEVPAFLAARRPAAPARTYLVGHSWLAERGDRANCHANAPGAFGRSDMPVSTAAGRGGQPGLNAAAPKPTCPAIFPALYSRD